MNNVTPSPTEHLSTTTYLDFTGFNQKCFISRTMQVRGCYVPGRAESRNAQRRHAFATLRLTSTLEKEVLMPKVWLITGSSRGLGRACRSSTRCRRQARCNGAQSGAA